ncbi:MAG: FAD-binding protein, partial [Planctomycetota bacterium]
MPTSAPPEPAPARNGVPSGRLAGWGRHPVVEGRELLSEDLEAITSGAVLTRGLGRSYGDSSLPPSPETVAANSQLADRILSFDEMTGVVRAEAGVPLFELNRLLLPRLWFTPVSPGTQFVTL